MKLVYFDDFKLGVLKGDAVVDVSAEVRDIPHTGPGDLMNGLIERWGSYKPRRTGPCAPAQLRTRQGRHAPRRLERIRPRHLPGLAEAWAAGAVDQLALIPKATRIARTTRGTRTSRFSSRPEAV